MRKVIIAVFLLLAKSIAAQEGNSIQLEEVSVEAARIVTKSDGLLILPTNKQLEASFDAYSLLAKLALPMLRVNVVEHSIVSVDNKGGVQIRINDVPTTVHDFVAIDPKMIKNIEFIDKPGVRYGEGIAYVININLHKRDYGYSSGFNLSNAITIINGSNDFFTSFNRGKSEFSLGYTSIYADRYGSRYFEEADYKCNDGVHYYISRQSSSMRKRNYDNTVQLKYNLSDSASYVFQATVNAGISNNPGSSSDFKIVDAGIEGIVSSFSKVKTISPSIDLYYFRKIGEHQYITANAVSSYIDSDTYNFINEGGNYEYDVKGLTYSLITEAIYENRLRPFNFSAGVKSLLKHTVNKYSGDVKTNNDMRNRSAYFFAEIKGGLFSKLDYTVGLGISNENYRQASYRYDFWLLRPKLSVGYKLVKNAYMSYGLEITPHVSKVAMISDTRIRRNSREWIVGNPNIEPNRVTIHNIKISYSMSRIYSQLYAECRFNSNPNMASYSRSADNQFYYTQRNQPYINMFFVQNYNSVTIIPDKLTLSVLAGAYRFINAGDNYKHYLTTYNFSGDLRVYLGKWNLAFCADSGWKFMEGETWNKQGAEIYASCGYRFKHFSMSVYWYNPFLNNVKQNYAELLNDNIKKKMTHQTRDLGNMVIINLSWKINQGRRFKDVEKKLSNKDTETGII